MSLRYIRQARGYQVETGPGGIVREVDTFTCQHCNRVIEIAPMADPADVGGYCKQCDSLICPKCVAQGGCDPIEKRIERYEASARFFREL